MRFASLGSGSKGNATLVDDGDGNAILIDCGVGIRQVEQRLRDLDSALDQIRAVLITHEHGDHCKGVESLLRRIDVPIYMTHGTATKGGFEALPGLQLIEDFSIIEVGRFRIQPIAVPHDAREPCQFVVEKTGPGPARKLGVLTDLGSFTPHVLEQYDGCDALVLECNHDEQMLQDGSYPPTLKRRVGGEWGHLSNRQAAGFLESVNTEQLQWLVVAHVSEQNNTPELARQAVQGSFNRGDRITLADQSRGFDWHAIA